MESQTSVYETTQQNAVISFHPQQTVDDVHFINTLLLKLIPTVDLDELLTLYYQHCQQALPLEVLSLITEDTKWLRGKPLNKVPFELSFALRDSCNKHMPAPPILNYQMARELSHCEKSLLTQAHKAISHLICHALSFAKLNKLAMKDELTGLGNRTAFNEDGETIRQACLRKNTQFGLLILDLDNFKSVNDSFGHDEGDNVLVSFASILSQSLRANERAYRFGGDEFCCLLETNKDNTINLVAKRILANAAKHILLRRHGVTVSMGGTLFMHQEALLNTFKRADKALYQVKQQGKHGYLLC